MRTTWSTMRVVLKELLEPSIPARALPPRRPISGEGGCSREPNNSSKELQSGTRMKARTKDQPSLQGSIGKKLLEPSIPARALPPRRPISGRGLQPGTQQLFQGALGSIGKIAGALHPCTGSPATKADLWGGGLQPGTQQLFQGALVRHPSALQGLT
ncbi:unnamed protein product [Caenorhabditis auriculariae]|uniref:Uncharacterized protein n=1 Tax=Caenorhabditis auriculariae TaxID=2777116 RepID=A0A8S1H0J3_9PELO|nr:unnamed protein product [Caenorhabditis auriculariae]